MKQRGAFWHEYQLVFHTILNYCTTMPWPEPSTHSDGFPTPYFQITLPPNGHDSNRQRRGFPVQWLIMSWVFYNDSLTYTHCWTASIFRMSININTIAEEQDILSASDCGNNTRVYERYPSGLGMPWDPAGWAWGIGLEMGHLTVFALNIL